MNLRNVSIKTKMLILTIGIGLFFIIAGIGSFIYIRQIPKYAALSANIAEFQLQFSETRLAQKNFLLVAFSNSTFFENGQNENIDLFEDNYIICREKISEELINNIILNNEIVSKITTIENQLIQYHDVFNELVVTIRERGDSQSGTIGLLRIQTEELRSFLISLPENEIYLTKLDRIDAKILQYTCTHNINSKSNVIDQLYLFKQLLKEADTDSLSATRSLTFSEALKISNKYSESFIFFSYLSTISRISSA